MYLNIQIADHLASAMHNRLLVTDTQPAGCRFAALAACRTAPTLCGMSTVTLGYEDDTTISKREIAKLQLTEAITLFLVGRYVCAITLAGAADAVLAGLLSHRDQPSVVEDSVAAIQRIRENTGLAVGGEKREQSIIQRLEYGQKQA